MIYTKFRIRNFKGIKDTTIDMSESGRVGVFTFVGLNESGKTTVLEAIHTFSPDVATSELVGGDKSSGVPFKARVPRHLISNFTGEVSVIATVFLNQSDKEQLADRLWANHQITLDVATCPDYLELEKKQTFKGGDYQKNDFLLLTDLSIKTAKQRSWRKCTSEEQDTLLTEVYNSTPDIVYFPTFVFDFPKRVFLTENRGELVNRFYRRVFQDILDYDKKGHTVEENIVGRIRSQSLVVPWLPFLTAWNGNDNREKIQHVMDRAGAVVTKVVFGRWNEIFGEDVRGKEVIISYEVVEGEVKDKNGVTTKTNEHDVFIKFQIRDGTRRFDVNDRSLGFRWFFAFMLLTQFRVARDSTRPILFLFDEPASNLHAAAQKKLIESFPEIAQGEHSLAYTTHSHYMIEPKWLEQTFIVSNRTDAPAGSVLDDISLDDESLDVTVERYRSFVTKHPSSSSYFQPVLDRLKVVPSRFDLEKNSVVVEGKSDYYIIRYGNRLLKKREFSVIPGLGAGTFGALVAMNVGWNLNMIFVLDSDNAGLEAREKYVTEYGLPLNRSIMLSEILPEISQIEDMLDAEAIEIIRNACQITTRPTKGQIRRFFQERLASDNIESLGKVFEKNITILIDQLARHIPSGKTASEKDTKYAISG